MKLYFELIFSLYFKLASSKLENIGNFLRLHFGEKILVFIEFYCAPLYLNVLQNSNFEFGLNKLFLGLFKVTIERNTWI